MSIRHIRDLFKRGILTLDTNGRISYPHPWENTRERILPETPIEIILPVTTRCGHCGNAYPAFDEAFPNCPVCGKQVFERGIS